MSDDELLTTEEIAAELKIHRSTVQRWLREGRMDYIELSQGEYRVRRSALNSFLAQRERKATKSQDDGT